MAYFVVVVARHCFANLVRHFVVDLIVTVNLVEAFETIAVDHSDHSCDLAEVVVHAVDALRCCLC